MTRYIDDRLEAETIRETRTPVRLPMQPASVLFPGWGPKF